MLPLLCWGTFTTEEQYQAEAKARNEPTDFPAIPGVFALQKPYEKMVCLISDNCPARYVNDCKGVAGAVPNIMFVQHDDPRTLHYDPMKGLHLFLQAQCTKDIDAGEQLFTSYGDLFWEEHAAINRQPINDNLLLDVGDIPAEVVALEDSEDEPLSVLASKQVTTPETKNVKTKRHKNASVLTQLDSNFMSSPVSLIGSTEKNYRFDEFDDEFNPWPTPSPSSKRDRSATSGDKRPDSADGKRAKRVTSSGGGKDVELRTMPQQTDSPRNDIDFNDPVGESSYGEEVVQIRGGHGLQQLLEAEALM